MRHLLVGKQSKIGEVGEEEELQYLRGFFFLRFALKSSVKDNRSMKLNGFKLNICRDLGLLDSCKWMRTQCIRPEMPLSKVTMCML